MDAVLLAYYCISNLLLLQVTWNILLIEHKLIWLVDICEKEGLSRCVCEQSARMHGISNLS